MPKNPYKLRYFSPFTGIGGFELGIIKAYERAIRHHRAELEKGSKAVRHRHDPSDELERHPVPVCAGYSEVDRHAISIYQKHFPNHENFGDITKIDADALPDFDLLVGGFPCQAFSVAGKRKGFEDTRGTLFFDLARILRAKRPRYFVFENVKGLLSHDGGKTFRTIISTLDELGYDVQWQVLNSKDFGVPQNRERVYIVGHLRGGSRPKVFPFIGDPEENPRRIGQDISSCLDANYHARARQDGDSQPVILQQNMSGQVFRRRDAGTIRAGASKNYQVVRIPEATKKGYAVAEPGDSINLSVLGSATRRGRVGKKIAQTLDTGMQQYTLHPEVAFILKARSDSGIDKKHPQTLVLQRPRGNNAGSTHKTAPCLTGKSYQDNNHVYFCEDCNDVHGDEGLRMVRRLTPVECERLQGFPDGWTADGSSGPISDTQRYKTLGNAVTTNVVEAVMYPIIVDFLYGNKKKARTAR